MLGDAVEDADEVVFTGAVRQSVYAFQKAQGIAVDGAVGPLTRAKLRDPEPVRSRYRRPADHIEVDKSSQLLLVIRDAPGSSGS